MMNFICFARPGSYYSSMIVVPEQVDIEELSKTITTLLGEEIVSTGQLVQDEDNKEQFITKFSTKNHEETENLTLDGLYRLLSERTKYIKFTTGTPATNFIVLFPGYIEHREMKNIISRTLENSVIPLSAGFVSTEDVLKCYGESIGLSIRSDPEEDTLLLKKQLSLI